MPGTSGPVPISTRLQRIAELAKQSPGMVLTTLAHHIDVEFLREAYRRTRKDGAVGIDGQTASEYAEDLEGNLRSLHERFKSGGYRAPAVRRAYIPKGEGKTRPLGIPTFEDKILQRAVTMVLEAVYEQDFLDCSYGFRPSRSAHQALQRLRDGLMEMRGGVVIDVDISGFFDALPHAHLRDFLDQRVRDGVIRRTIGKWLQAGVMEDGRVSRSETGSPQGGVVSPVLSNVYLHHVLDVWFEEMVRPRLYGRGFMIRYADDVVIVLSKEEDARRVMAVLPKRLGKYGLTLHPEKTRVVPFHRPSTPRGRDDRGEGPGTFDFLGFTHYWAKSRRGNQVIKQKTAKDRFRRALKRVAEWCRRQRHLPLVEQHRALSAKLRGHYGYYGITANSRALSRFRDEVQRAWRKWLARRDQTRRMPWCRFTHVMKRYPLPAAICVHSIYRHAANP